MKPAVNLSRRRLLCAAGTAVISSRAFASQDPSQSLIDRAFAARDKGDFAIMASLLRQAVAMPKPKICGISRTSCIQKGRSQLHLESAEMPHMSESKWNCNRSATSHSYVLAT